MDLERLIEILSDPRAYPHPCEAVEVHQTHISAVFLAGPYAYKIKKPLNLGFLDFGTLEKRHHYCLEEVRLNRRLAPGVYLGVLPITAHQGEIRVDGAGQVIEWAVWMERLPQEATLKERLARSEAAPDLFDALARKLAQFHAQAQSGEHISTCGRWEVVARNARENFEQSAGHVGTTVSRAVFDRSRELTERALVALRPLIDTRARRGVPRDTHGDLHLDHVYSFPDRAPPDDLIAVDCIEFNERFRYGDPVGDTAFLVMDLLYSDRRDLARRFSSAYFQASGDAEGASLLPLYTAYRAAVRGKVEGLEVFETEVSAAEKDRALVAARAHWLVGLGCLETPSRRPCLVCVGGLPGTGKSTLSRGLAESAGFEEIRSDVVRKELAGLAPGAGAPASFGEGIYSPDWDRRTYTEVLQRAEERLFRGGRVLVDASFREEATRQAFLDAARRSGVPGLLLLCEAAPGRVRERLAARKGDASDADWSVYLAAAERWEAPGPKTSSRLHRISTRKEPAQALALALGALRTEELV